MKIAHKQFINLESSYLIFHIKCFLFLSSSHFFRTFSSTTASRFKMQVSGTLPVFWIKNGDADDNYLKEYLLWILHTTIT